MNETNFNETTMVTETEETPVTYTVEQVQQAFNDGQRNGYIAAIRQIRNDINTYLDDIIVSVKK